MSLIITRYLVYFFATRVDLRQKIAIFGVKLSTQNIPSTENTQVLKYF